MPASLNSRKCQQCEQGQADFMHFSSPQAARTPSVAEAGKGRAPLNPLILRSPLLAVHKAAKRKKGRERGFPCRPAGASGPWLRTRSGRGAFIAQNSPTGFRADRRFSNPLEDGGASLCTHASRLRDPGAALFQQNHPVTTGTRPDDYSSAESATATVSAGRSRTNPNRAILALSPNRFLAVRTILV